MKRLMILTAAAILTVGAVGCGGRLFNRGSACNTYPAATEPCVDPCMGAPAATITEGALPAPVVYGP
ncbi:MAG TPA: hypothetical protein VMV10_10740 [Pirellulales bacterium]|nr:hypothetical protein [Pirellulales bacterium]